MSFENGRERTRRQDGDSARGDRALHDFFHRQPGLHDVTWWIAGRSWDERSPVQVIEKATWSPSSFKFIETEVARNPLCPRIWPPKAMELHDLSRKRNRFPVNLRRVPSIYVLCTYGLQKDMLHSAINQDYYSMHLKTISTQLTHLAHRVDIDHSRLQAAFLWRYRMANTVILSPTKLLSLSLARSSWQKPIEMQNLPSLSLPDLASCTS